VVYFPCLISQSDGDQWVQLGLRLRLAVVSAAWGRNLKFEKEKNRP